MHSSAVMLASSPCLFSDAAACPVTMINSIAGISEPQWGESGSALSVLGNSPVGLPGWVMSFSATLAEDAGVRLAQRDQAAFTARAYDLVRRGTGETNSEALAATYNDAVTAIDPAATVWTGLYWMGRRYIGSLSETRADRTLIARVAGEETRPDVLGPLVPDSELAIRRGRDDLIIVGTGYESGQADHTSPGAFPRPAYDSLSGELLGLVGRRTVALQGELHETSLRLSEALAQLPSAQVEAVSASVDTGVIVAQARELDGDLLLLWASADGSAVDTRRVECGSDLPGVSVRYEDWGTPERPLPATMYALDNSRKLLIFMHGGPGVRGSDVSISPSTELYLRMGYSVAMVEYSGSAGVGLNVAGRIRSEGYDALRQDAQAIERQASVVRPDYDLIGLHAESFGGSLLTAASYEGVDFIVAIAPWVQYLPVEEWRYRQLPADQIDSQRKYEDAFFGSRDTPDRLAFESALSSASRQWRPAAPLMLLLGERDDHSRRESFAHLDGSPIVSLTVIPGATHASIFGIDQLRRICPFLASVDTSDLPDCPFGWIESVH